MQQEKVESEFWLVIKYNCGGGEKRKKVRKGEKKTVQAATKGKKKKIFVWPK